SGNRLRLHSAEQPASERLRAAFSADCAHPDRQDDRPDRHAGKLPAARQREFRGRHGAEVTRELMFTRLKQPALSETELFAALDPELSRWFQRRFGRLAPAQAIAVPEILAGRSLLLSSPTGSGK